jgi:hypothetical protein
MIRHRGSRSWYAPARLALVGSLAILAASESRAGGLIPIDFDPSRPLIVATDGSVAYDAPTGNFNVQAIGLFFLSNDLPGGLPVVPVDSGSAVIKLTLDKSGNLLAPGSIALTGGIDFEQDGVDDVSGSLVTGKVTAFGAAGPGPAPWEFDGLFTFTGGGLTQSSIPLSGGGTFSDLFRVGETGGFDLVVEQQVSGILGDFAQSFSGNTNKGPVVGVSVPEPATSTMALIVSATVVGWRLLRRLRARIRRRAAG